jgi:hypothetical protein
VRNLSLGRAVPAALAGAALLLGGAACGGDDVDKGALVNKIKSDASFTPALNDGQATCVADAVIKYLDSADINSYLKDGKMPEPKKDKDKAATDIQACIKK